MQADDRGVQSQAIVPPRRSASPCVSALIGVLVMGCSTPPSGAASQASAGSSSGGPKGATATTTSEAGAATASTSTSAGGEGVDGNTSTPGTDDPHAIATNLPLKEPPAPLPPPAERLNAPIDRSEPPAEFWKQGDAACDGGKLNMPAPVPDDTIRCVDDKGRWVGPFARFGEDGELEQIGRTVEGRFQGRVVYFHEGGAVAAEHFYDQGELHGPLVRYAPDGSVIERGEYRAGRPWGVFEFADASGALVRSELVDGTGTLTRVGGHGVTTEPHVAGLLHGTLERKDTSGKFIGKTEWSGGEWHGLEVNLRSDGTRWETRHYGGARHGLSTTYAPDGAILERSLFAGGDERWRVLYVGGEPLMPEPAPHACDTNVGINKALIAGRERGLEREHPCVERSALFPWVIRIGSFAHDRGCMGEEWLIDCAYSKDAPDSRAAFERAGWAKATPEQREILLEEWLRQIAYAFEGGIMSVPERIAFEHGPDGSVTATFWLQEPSGMRRASTSHKIEYVVAPDLSTSAKVLETQTDRGRD